MDALQVQEQHRSVRENHVVKGSLLHTRDNALISERTTKGTNTTPQGFSILSLLQQQIFTSPTIVGGCQMLNATDVIN